MRVLFFKIFVSVIFFFLLSLRTAAAQTDWVINNFQSTITIQADGNVLVKEAVDVDFNNLEKHGIYRDIPVVYKDETSEKTYTKITVLAVLQDGKKAVYKLITNDNNLRIRIGDPDRTINGLHSYEIQYLATGVLRSFTDHDELYWNVTGSDWEADILKASATVIVPKEEIIKTTCFEGYVGYTNQCTIDQQGLTTVRFTTTRDLPPTQGLTIVTGYTKGMVPILTVPPPKKLSDDFSNPLTPLAFFFSFFGGIAGIWWLWMKNGRDFWFRVPHALNPNAKEEVRPIGAHETIVVEFTPPENLRPAEIGVLMDERADTLDVTATIIDLANRGFLTIAEIDKKWIFGTKDYELHRTDKPEVKLLDYESLLLKRLFATGDTIKTSALKTTFYDDLAEVKKKLYEVVVNKKLFPKNPDATKNKYAAIGVGIVFLQFLCLFGGFALTSGPIVASCVGGILSGIIFIFAARSMSRRSAIGREVYRRAKGYQLFIGGAEKYRQQFYERKNMFNEILPYAIVFGLTEKFAKAMKDMGITPAKPTWYSGRHSFIPVVFASDINSFSNSLSNAIASTPAKSGGFSGGSSGGGFGGGGGGSW